MASSEFRRRYATLTKPTVVTVLGRPIGIWEPRIVDEGIVGFQRNEVVEPVSPAFNSRPFTPVPKKGSRERR